MPPKADVTKTYSYSELRTLRTGYKKSQEDMNRLRDTVNKLVVTVASEQRIATKVPDYQRGRLAGLKEVLAVIQAEVDGQAAIVARLDQQQSTVPKYPKRKQSGKSASQG